MLVHPVAVPGSGTRSWTVLGDDDVPVVPVDRFLAYLTGIGRSPNTVKAYAHDVVRQPPHALGAPPAEGQQDRLKLVPVRGELIDRAAVRQREQLPPHDTRRFQVLEPRGQRIGADSRQALDQIAEPERPEQQIAQDEQRPAIPDHVEGGGDAAQLGVAAHRSVGRGHLAITLPYFINEI